MDEVLQIKALDLSKENGFSCLHPLDSIVHYHVVPTWARLSIERKRRIRTIVFQTARLIMKAPKSVHGWIACVEVKVLAPDQRYRLLLLER